MTAGRQDERRGRADTPVSELLNLGPVSSAQLRQVGVVRRADLERIGAILVYRMLKHRFPGVSVNMLYALHGAVTDVRWNELSPEVRRSLRAEAACAMQVPPRWEEGTDPPGGTGSVPS